MLEVDEHGQTGAGWALWPGIRKGDLREKKNDQFHTGNWNEETNLHMEF